MMWCRFHQDKLDKKRNNLVWMSIIGISVHLLDWSKEHFLNLMKYDLFKNNKHNILYCSYLVYLKL